MQSFTDRADRTWNLVLNVSMARMVKDKLKHDLLDLEKVSIAKLFNDPYLLVDILFVMCEAQTLTKKWTKKWEENGEQKTEEKTDVSEYEFAEGLAGDTIDKATEALLNEISDFLPNHRLRKIFLKSLKKTNEAMDKVFNQLDEAMENPKLIEKVTAEATTMISQELTSGISSGTTPES